MELALQKKTYDFLKRIFDTGLYSVQERQELKEILSEMEQTHIPTIDTYEMVRLMQSYIVDRDDPDDEKWEGAKELKLAEEIGKEILRKGCLEKSHANIGEAKERHYYTCVVLKKNIN